MGVVAFRDEDDQEDGMQVGAWSIRGSMLAMAGVLWMVQGAAAQAPSGSTGQCKDGSYTSQATKSGACRGHKGIQTWFADAGSAAKPAVAAASKAAPAAPAPPATPAAAPALSAPAASTAAPAKGGRMSPEARAASMPQAPGGGSGKVWVNTDSKVYHCEGDAFYGKTKKGQYMSEADAKAAGAHADRNKPCTK